MVTVKRYFKGVRKPDCARSWWSFPLAIIVVGVLLLFIRGFFFTQMSVAEGTLHPILIGGDRILVNRTAYGLRLPFAFGESKRHLASTPPKKGEWCIIELPNQPGEYALERITAVEGEFVKIEGSNDAAKRLEKGTYATEKYIIQHQHLVGRPICTTYSIDRQRSFVKGLRTDRFFISLP